MSDSLYVRLLEDRAMRDSAKSLVRSDFTHVKEDLSSRSLGSRLKMRASDGASELLDEATEIAKDNKGVLAVLIGALSLWIMKNPILSFFEDEEDDEVIDPRSYDRRHRY